MTAAAPTAQLSVGQLAERIALATDGALAVALRGSADTMITAVAPLDTAGADHLS
mgnify:FL=1